MTTDYRSFLVSCPIAVLASIGCQSSTALEPQCAQVQPKAEVAEARGGAPAAAETSEPAALRPGEHEKLAALVGDWTGKGTLKMGDQPHAVQSRMSCRVAPGGVAVRCEHEAQVEGMGQMFETAVFGFEPNSKKLHWYNVNNMGETHDHVGQWASDTRLEWSFDGEQEGKPMTEAISMSFDAADTLSFRSETKVGGERLALFEGMLRK